MSWTNFSISGRNRASCLGWHKLQTALNSLAASWCWLGMLIETESFVGSTNEYQKSLDSGGELVGLDRLVNKTGTVDDDPTH
jgi:hypothetical protein